jgi:hypothetical protein
MDLTARRLSGFVSRQAVRRGARLEPFADVRPHLVLDHGSRASLASVRLCRIPRYARDRHSVASCALRAGHGEASEIECQPGPVRARSYSWRGSRTLQGGATHLVRGQFPALLRLARVVVAAHLADMQLRAAGGALGMPPVRPGQIGQIGAAAPAWSQIAHQAVSSARQ